MSLENMQATSSASQVSGGLETKETSHLGTEIKVYLNPDRHFLFLYHYHFSLLPA